METRIAVIGIIVENKDSVESVNELLHQYSQYIIGRMGLPYPKKKVNIISVLHEYGGYIVGRMGLPYEKKKMNIISIVVDAPQDIISALSGKLGRLQGINSKALYSNIGS